MKRNHRGCEQMIAQSSSRQRQGDTAVLYPVSSELLLAGCRAWLDAGPGCSAEKSRDEGNDRQIPQVGQSPHNLCLRPCGRSHGAGLTSCEERPCLLRRTCLLQEARPYCWPWELEAWVSLVGRYSAYHMTSHESHCSQDLGEHLGLSPGPLVS